MATALHSLNLGELAHGAIANYLQAMAAYKKPVLADTDPENLHQMRVGLRRLRTAVQVFEVGLDLPKAGREPAIAAIGCKLGQLRDLDVTWMILRDRYALDLPENEQACLGKVLLRLAKRRHKTFKQVKQLLKGDRYVNLKQSLAAWVDEPRYRAIAALSADYLVPDLVLPLISQLWLHPGWLVGTKASRSGLAVNTRLSLKATDALIADQGPRLHSLRKQVKRVRYQLRLVSDLYPNSLEDDIQRLSNLQDTLGNLQDSMVLSAFLEDVIPDAKAQMPTLFALLTDSRHRAWKQWQGYQKHYLDPAQRQQLQLTLLNPTGSRREDGANANKPKEATASTTTPKPPAPRRSTANRKAAGPKTSRRATKPKKTETLDAE
ncbi:CHAD domain-containing protein [Nodosilinea sp. LEGE 07088]|uniref:CHAD domain-containing protein n=1 Tax=Nodosilinea sp. LEGE 07088 TaxID=2777968 RepID=UPI00187FA8AD|nr:CHAD domain-containing protein [Nodosilinea sp. LEGE 07088]MBE9139591.1 CHAD domain-containing protein [Nodosilinea sp. LEGE 07088]